MDLIWAYQSIFFIFFILYEVMCSGLLFYFIKRQKDDWIIDLTSLIIQGTIIPIFQTIILYNFLDYLMPSLNGSLEISGIASFVLNFVFVDYVYYWVHRIFHNKRLWGFHLLHHSAKQMDVLVTSRNSFWTSFVFPYIWLNSLFIFMLKAPDYYILSMAITAILDMWKHSQFIVQKKNIFFNYLSFIFVTPFEHHGHHSTQYCQNNFGANLVIWDKFHKTYLNHQNLPKKIGLTTFGNLSTKLFRPFKLNKENK